MIIQKSSSYEAKVWITQNKLSIEQIGNLLYVKGQYVSGDVKYTRYYDSDYGSKVELTANTSVNELQINCNYDKILYSNYDITNTVGSVVYNTTDNIISTNQYVQAILCSEVAYSDGIKIKAVNNMIYEKFNIIDGTLKKVASGNILKNVVICDNENLIDCSYDVWNLGMQIQFRKTFTLVKPMLIEVGPGRQYENISFRALTSGARITVDWEKTGTQEIQFSLVHMDANADNYTITDLGVFNYEKNNLFINTSGEQLGFMNIQNGYAKITFINTVTPVYFDTQAVEEYEVEEYNASLLYEHNPYNTGYGGESGGSGTSGEFEPYNPDPIIIDAPTPDGSILGYIRWAGESVIYVFNTLVNLIQSLFNSTGEIADIMNEFMLWIPIEIRQILILSVTIFIVLKIFNR